MKKTWHRLLLDVIMLLGLASLYSDKVVSMAYHEIGGVVLGVVFLLHLVFNFKWIKSVFVKVFCRGVLWRTRLLALVDVLLLVSWGMVIYSGACISKVVFSFRAMGQWKMLHFFFAALSLVLTGIHLGFHVKYLGVHIKKLLPLPGLVKKILVVVLSVVILVFGFMNYNDSELGRWISMPLAASAMGGPSGEMGGPGGPSGEMETVKPTAEPDPNPPVVAAEPETAPEPAAEESSSGEMNRTAASGEVEENNTASGEQTQTRTRVSGEMGGPSGEMGGPSGEMGFQAGRLLAVIWEFGSVVLAVMTITGWVDWLCLWAKKRIRTGKKAEA